MLRPPLGSPPWAFSRNRFRLRQPPLIPICWPVRRARRRGWPKLKPDMVKLYTTNFSESELKDLVAFYQSPLGKKVLEKMPQLTQQSAQMTQAKLESAVPVVNKLLADMTAELEPAAAPATKK